MGTPEGDYRYIIDLDGSLYPYTNKQGQTVQKFGESTIGDAVRTRTNLFLQEKLHYSEAEALAELERLYTKYNGEISSALEQEHDIDRDTYFTSVWNINPADVIVSEGNVRESLLILKEKMALLTAAPTIWAVRAIAYLQIEDLFALLHTGEQDLRKPDPQVFTTLIQKLGGIPEKGVSVGDNNAWDIVPANIGELHTIIVGPHIQDAQERIDDIHQLASVVYKRGWY